MALLVPSAVIPESPERNVLINPTHPDFSRFRLLDVKPYRFDERLRRQVRANRRGGSRAPEEMGRERSRAGLLRPSFN